jgi:hypothetical protein
VDLYLGMFSVRVSYLTPTILTVLSCSLLVFQTNTGIILRGRPRTILSGSSVICHNTMFSILKERLKLFTEENERSYDM